jgi:hypothetical protein
VSSEDAIIKKVHYFDGTEGMNLSKDLKMLLNSKLDKMYNIYNEKLDRLCQNNHKIFKELIRYRVLSDEDPAEALSVDRQVEKVLMITQDPNDVWEAIET